MKKLVALLLFALVGSAWAGGNHYNHYNRHHHHRHYNWVAPAVIGGVVTYALTRPQYVAPPPPPVYYQTQPYYTQPAPQCTRYVYQDQYGNVQREEVRCN